jgi:hypothetical protein
MADLQNVQNESSESRSNAFAGGVAGGGLGTYVASVLPRVQQAKPAFDPSGSVLQAANQYSGIGNASSDSTLKISDPYGVNMRNSLRQSSSGKAEE